MQETDMKPKPVLEDPAGVQRKLQRWLNDSVFTTVTCTVSDLRIPEDTGMSNITALFDVSVAGKPVQPMVGRLQAQGDKLAFPVYDLPMQYSAMQALAQIDGLRVPELLAQEPTGVVLGTPFYIMRRTDGLIPPDIPPYHMDGWIAESTPPERAALWRSGIEMMATLHRQLPAREPLKSFLATQTIPGDLTGQIAYWNDYRQWGLDDRHAEISLRAATWLAERQPPTPDLRLCWGDARMANVIFRPDKSGVAALLDWEMLAVGDPVQDLAWWIYLDELFSHGLGIERLAGFPGRDESAQIWARAAALPCNHLHYYLVFAGWRMALILARMSLASGDGSMVEGGFAWDYLAKVLDEA